MSRPVTEVQFQDLLQSGLADFYPRALVIFRKCGSLLSFDVTNVLCHARDQGPEKVEQVLQMLERHWEEHLHFQHPEIRGTVEDRLLGVNKTQTLFLRICKDVLRLQPTA